MIYMLMHVLLHELSLQFSDTNVCVCVCCSLRRPFKKITIYSLYCLTSRIELMLLCWSLVRREATVQHWYLHMRTKCAYQLYLISPFSTLNKMLHDRINRKCFGTLHMKRSHRYKHSNFTIKSIHVNLHPMWCLSMYVIESSNHVQYVTVVFFCFALFYFYAGDWCGYWR